MNLSPSIGAVYHGEGRCMFRVWAPFAKKVEVRILSPIERTAEMERDDKGYWKAELNDVAPGTRYVYRLDDSNERPDPASFDQPEGVHKASRVLDLDFAWTDSNWSGPSLRDYVIYELHAGAFTPEGTFEAIIPRLDSLIDLGITNLEIMPVAQFPGARNWGYDGVNLFAVQNSYGGPDGLRRLVDACHRKGLSVTLDVVYNHMGPEGNYLREFGPYFTNKYVTPWGEALNYDDAQNDEVREFFLQNALFWFKVYHIDALRLDAVHAIYDRSAIPFLSQLAERTAEFRRQSGRKAYLIAESDLNDSRLLRSPEVWGCGLDSQWADDFHHSLHSLLTGEREGYYMDFGRVGDLVTALKEGYVYSGKFSPARKRSHGNRSSDLPSEQFVVAAQNHDQVGNRMLGERLPSLTSFEGLKLGAAALLLSPYVPLLFMGEEYGEKAPFLYFVDHSDPALIEAVTKGRKEEFKDFSWEAEPPDPFSVESFELSRLNWEKREQGKNRLLLNFYRELLKLRREHPAIKTNDRSTMEVSGSEETKVVVMKHKSGSPLVVLLNFDKDDSEIAPGELSIEPGLRKVLDSSDQQWGGPGSLLPETLGDSGRITIRANSAAVFIKA